MVATIQLTPARPVAPALRLHARRRLTVLIATAVAVLLAPVVLGVVGAIQGGESSTLAPAAAAPSGPAAAAPTYVVQPGDTLWSIATRVAPGHDVRATVDRLVLLNGGAALRVGQRLRVDDGG